MGSRKPSPLTVAVVAVALALASNLATNTVRVSWRWWPAAVWTLVAVLVAATMLVEWRRHRNPAAEHPAPRVFGAIPRAGWQFQDRPAAADQVRRALRVRGGVALVALVGPRGAGKTQLAAATARGRAEAGYDLVAWIKAESGPVPELAALARVLGLHGAGDSPAALAEAVRGWLERDNRARRLMVFDNVDDPDALRPFLPATGAAQVIITTNRQEFTTMDGISAVTVGMLTPAEGQDFLRAATGLPTGPDAAELGRELGWLPLGLAQAAASIKRGRLSYRRYLQALDAEDLAGTLRRQPGADHPGVFKATQLSVAALTPDAASLLAVLSFLAPDGISRALLTTGEAALDLTGSLTHAVAALTAASLVNLGGTAHGAGDGVTITVHRLTARVIRGRASATKAIAVAVRLLRLLAEDLPLISAARRRGELDELVAHILALRGHTDRPPAALLALTFWAAEALHEVGDNARARATLETTLADRTSMLGPDHPDTLDARHHLASFSGEDGAVETFEVLLADRQRVLGADHEDTLATRHRLAYAVGDAGDPDAAVTAFEALLADRTRVLGAAHPETLGNRNDLAHWRGMAGDPAGAADALESLVADQIRLLDPDPDHAGTLSIRLHQAYWRGEAGDLAGAVAALEDLVADHRRALGADHPATLATRHMLAHRRRQTGDLAGARTELEGLCADEVRVLGPDHPDTLSARDDLAAAYAATGRAREAAAIRTDVLARSERTLGPGHPFTTAVRKDLSAAATRSRRR